MRVFTLSLLPNYNSRIKCPDVISSVIVVINDTITNYSDPDFTMLQSPYGSKDDKSTIRLTQEHIQADILHLIDQFMDSSDFNRISKDITDSEFNIVENLIFYILSEAKKNGTLLADLNDTYKNIGKEALAKVLQKKQDLMKTQHLIDFNRYSLLNPPDTLPNTPPKPNTPPPHPSPRPTFASTLRYSPPPGTTPTPRSPPTMGLLHNPARPL